MSAFYGQPDPAPAQEAHAAADPAMGHVPVLPRQVLELLDPRPGQVVLDCTAGRGGHASLILPRIQPGGTYIGLDLDPRNVEFTRERLRLLPLPAPRGGRERGEGPDASDRHPKNSAIPDSPAIAPIPPRGDSEPRTSRPAVHVIHSSFVAARAVLGSLGIARVDRLLADLGFASNQVDDPARGFSFDRPGPLDMRLDPTQPTTAAELVHHTPERELADLIYRLGEERLSRRIAAKIAERRRIQPITSTDDLAQIVRRACGPAAGGQRIDPATRTFMALRIAVNGELDALDALLARLPDLLAPDAVAVFISFHSLEDRLVKRAFARWASERRADVLTRKPIQADPHETARNPRSRSAKLRALRWSR